MHSRRTRFLAENLKSYSAHERNSVSLKLCVRCSSASLCRCGVRANQDAGCDGGEENALREVFGEDRPVQTLDGGGDSGHGECEGSKTAHRI